LVVCLADRISFNREMLEEVLYRLLKLETQDAAPAGDGVEIPEVEQYGR